MFKNNLIWVLEWYIAISVLMIFMLADQGQSFRIRLVLEFFNSNRHYFELTYTKQKQKTIFIWDIGQFHRIQEEKNALESFLTPEISMIGFSHDPLKAQPLVRPSPNATQHFHIWDQHPNAEEK